MSFFYEDVEAQEEKDMLEKEERVETAPMSDQDVLTFTVFGGDKGTKTLRIPSDFISFQLLHRATKGPHRWQE